MEGKRMTLAVLLVLVMVSVSFSPLVSMVKAQEIDADGDGFSDKYERLMGTDPEDPTSFPVSTGGSGGPDTVEQFQIDLLPSGRIVAEGQAMSVAVYVRKDNELVGQRLVHLLVYSAVGQDLSLIDAQKDVLDNGRASFQYTPATTGILYFVATMEEYGANLGEKTTVASVVSKHDHQRIGFINIAVYQHYIATADAQFLHLLPGMDARILVHLYELKTSGITDDLVKKWVGAITPMQALKDLYQPASGAVYLTGSGPNGLKFEQTIQCDSNGGAFEPALTSIGDYTFQVSAYNDFRFFIDMASLAVHDPIYRAISIYNKYQLFETGQLQISVKRVSPTIAREDFDRYMRSSSTMEQFAKDHPLLMSPITGQVDYYVLYMQGQMSMVLKHGMVPYNGTAFDTYTFNVPGDYRVVVSDKTIPFPGGAFVFPGVPISGVFIQNIKVITDYTITTFPNKLTYFPAESVKLTTMFMSGESVVRDMPVAIFVDGKYLGQQKVKDGEFVIQNDLGKISQGGHNVKTLPVTSQDTLNIVNAFGVSAFTDHWTGAAVFYVRGIGIYFDLPAKAVRGMPFSFRLLALDAPMEPCAGCAYKVWLLFGSMDMLMASGTTDASGSAVVTFGYPDLYFDSIKVAITKNTDTVIVIKPIEPRAQMLSGMAITNKPIYKAGETVMLRFLVWNQDLLGPATGELDVRVTDPDGREISREKLTLDDFGAAQLQVPISTGQRDGDYQVQAWAAGQEIPVIDRTFKVEAYTTPSVEVSFSNDKNVVDYMTKGFSVPYSIKYTFGKEVTEGTVNWEYGYINKGMTSEHAVATGSDQVNGTWPMKVKFNLDLKMDPKDQVYVKISFKDQFGHNATGKLLLTVTEAGVFFNLGVILDKAQYKPGDKVGIRVMLTKETQSLGHTTIEPMGSQTLGVSVHAPDGKWFTSSVKLGIDGNWTGSLSDLGVDAQKYQRTGQTTIFTVEARYDAGVTITSNKDVNFITVEPVLSTDKDWYEAGQDAVIYMAVRDLVNGTFMSNTYDVRVHRENDEANLLFSAVGKLDGSSKTLVWKVPETLSTGIYVIETDLGSTHLSKSVRVEDKTPRTLTLTASEATFKPGDRIELKVEFGKPFTGRLYIDYMAQGRLQGTTLNFQDPTTTAVMDLTAGDWRSPIWAFAYFVASTGELVSDSALVGRSDVGLKVKVDTSKVEYEPGDIMTLTIEVSGSDGKAVPGAMLALSVIDASIFDIAKDLDDKSWMAAFGVPDTMDRGYALRSDSDTSSGVELGTYEQVAAFYGLSPSSDNQDFDNDGLSNFREWQLGTSMVSADSDKDGLPDGWEIGHSLNPLDPSDGLGDMDADGMTNGWEMRNGLDPTVDTDATSDNDNDNLTALDEFRDHTNPNDWDTDGDGMPDGWEVRYGLDPLDPSDAQGDINGNGVTNLEEFWMQTIPGRPIDYNLTDTTDTDSDQMPDVWEAKYGLDPFDPSDAFTDCDKDGWTNLMEFQQGTDPRNPNTDGDHYEYDSTDPNPLWNDDSYEGGNGGQGNGGGGSNGGGNGGSGNGQGSGGSGGGSGSGSGSSGEGYSGGSIHGGGLPDLGDHSTGSGVTLDSDGDGLTDLEEQALGTNPFKADTDGDGMPDPVDPRPLIPDKPVTPGGGTNTQPEEINPFIPHAATSKEIENFHSRKWFTDTAYWAPDLLLNKGVIRVGILLPDNIGRWQIKAAAFTPDLRSGETILEVNSYKGLFVEPVVPSGIYQDDEVTFKARVYNLDDKAKDVKVILTAGDWLRAFGFNERTIKMGANEVKEIPFFVKIDGMHEQSVKFGVSDGTTSDAVTANTYIQPNGAKKTQHFSGSVDDEVTMYAMFFPEYIAGSNNGTLKLSAGYDGLFLHGARVSAQYPYDCTEQTMTKLLTNVLIWKYGEAQGTLQGTEREELSKTIYMNLNRLLTLQHTDGGWGWWEKDSSDAWMTSYVLFGYSVVKAQGFHVASNSLSGGWQFMLKTASVDDTGATMWKGTSWLKHKDDTMTATVLYSMAASGYPGDMSSVVTYLGKQFSSGALTDAYTVTLYGLALNTLGKNVTSVREWLSANTMDGTHWAGGNSLGGQVETTGWATYFMVLTGTSAKDIRLTLTWLSQQRIGGAWSTTSTTIASLFAITEVLKTAKQPKADVKVVINGVVVKEFKGLNQFNFASFNAEFENLDISKFLRPGSPNEVRIVKTGEGDLFYELTDVQYLRTTVKVTFQAAAQGRVGDLIELWMNLTSNASKDLSIVGLSVGVPQASGLVLVNTRKVMTASTDTSVVRYIHTFAARVKGHYTLAPIVISYQLDAGEGPSGVIRDYFGPIDVLVKVPLSELAKRPGLKEEDLGDLINQTRDNIKDKVKGLTDDVKNKINETKKKITNVTDVVKDKVKDLKDTRNKVNGTIKPIDGSGTIIDDVPVKKITGARSMDIQDSSDVKVQVDAKAQSGTVTVVDFVPQELEVISVGDGGTVQDGKITWTVQGGKDTTLGYTVKAKEEYNGDMGRAVALGNESIAGVSNEARMVFTAKNFVLVRDVASSAYADELVTVKLTVMTTGTALWYAAIEDYAPAGAIIDEDSVAANLDDNVLSYSIQGNRATFFVRKAVNLTMNYEYMPSLVGTTIASPAKAYPMYDTANMTSSDSYAIAVDYRPPETEGGGAGSGADTHITPHHAGPRLTVSQEDIVLGEAAPLEKRLTSANAFVHNDGDVSVQATVSVYDLEIATGKKTLIGYQIALIEPGKSTKVECSWRPVSGEHTIVVEGSGGGATVQASRSMSVKAVTTSSGWDRQVTASSIVNGPGLLLVLALAIVISAAIAVFYGQKKAEQERKALEEAAKRPVRKVKKVSK